MRSRRLRPRRRGQLDLRRTLRHATRTGEITHLARRGRPHRPRRAAAADRRLRLAARAHARLPALRLGRAGRDVHVRHAAHPDHQGAAPPRRRRRAARTSAHASTTPTAAPGSAPRCRSSSTRPRYADRARGALTIVLSDGLERGDPAQMVHAVRRLKRLSARLLWWTPLGLDPTYRPITRAMAAISERRRARGRARPSDTARAGASAVNYVDAHHHIWPHRELPWLAGPMIPRIFGPYESLQGKRLHGRGVHRRRRRRTASRSPSTCRPTGRSSAPSTRSSGSRRSTTARAGRTRSSAPPTCSTRTRARRSRRRPRSAR